MIAGACALVVASNGGSKVQSKISIPKMPRPGRPFGKAVRKRITLPDGEVLIPFYTDWADEVGINSKYLQRNRHRFPLTKIAGITYVRDQAGRRALAEPKKARGARR